MSFIRHKLINKAKYAYEITAYWDKELKRFRQKSRYLGKVDEEGNISHKNTPKQEKLQLDFGNGYLLQQFMINLETSKVFSGSLKALANDLIPLISYCLCNKSAMYNAATWFEGNILSLLFKDANLSSQNISRIFKKLGNEKLQRDFFWEYLGTVHNVNNGIIIDATSLPSQCNTDFNAWGRNDGGIDKQMRMLCVVDQVSKMPLYYRYLPGNILDVSTLEHTIRELTLFGIKNKFVLVDAGYFSETNILELYKKQIDFLTRLPTGRLIYKDIISNHISDIENMQYATRCNERAVFVKEVAVDLFGKKGYAYIVLDPIRKAKELQQKMLDYVNGDPLSEVNIATCGIMILISSMPMNSKSVINDYYLRQSVEQVFGFYKDDLGLLPLRKHSDETISGYLLLQFIALVVFIQFRNKIKEKFTVEQALNITRNLKCKIFEDGEILVAEPTKKQKEIFELFDYTVPKKCGI
jgi:transposase